MKKRDTGALYVAHGSDAYSMTQQLLGAARPAAGWNKDAAIGLKPNLVVPKKWTSGATTNPAVCEAVIEYLLDNGFTNICIIESSWVGAKTDAVFRTCGYDELAKKYGVELVDVKKDTVAACEYDGMSIAISQRALALDHLINLPLIKGHCQTDVTCALKNMKGLIPDKEKRRFHAIGLHKPIAYLNKMITSSFVIADGTCADPTFEEGGSPACMNVMAAGVDSVLVDAYAATVLGHRPRDIGYIRIAEEHGIGSADLDSADIIAVGSGGSAVRHTQAKALDTAKAKIDARSACSACYANLVSALLALDYSGPDVCIGQAFKGRTGDVGCGQCTSGFDVSIPGCPPDTETMMKTLKQLRRDA